LEGFGELYFFVTADATGVVGPLRSALRIIFTKVALRTHHFHGGRLFFEDRCDVQECIRVKPAEFGLVRLKQKQRWRLNGFEGAGHSCAGGKLTRLLGGRVSHAVIGVKRVFLGMGEDNGGFKVTNERSEPLYRCPV
jgi:hypothetical protein